MRSATIWKHAISANEPFSRRVLGLRYVSTRGAAPDLGFDDVLLTGLARDGGLYVPAEWPRFDDARWRDLAGRSYAEIAEAVLAPFLAGSIAAPALPEILARAYSNFRHPAIAPLKQLRSNDWLMELFHGPTLAFKDYALQLLGQLFDHVLTARGQRIAILGATSGDTGSAAIESVRDRQAVDIFILFPHGRVSEVQRRQMTTVTSANVHAIAVEGSFDDCQDIVKALFNDLAFRDAAHLAAANSINWARIVAQTVYYAVAALALGAPDRKVGFAVPTGNFGNVYAGYVARQMGLPIEKLVIGTNRNDILARFLASGTMATAPVEPSLSPSMDIQVSSNFERLLFELQGRDGAKLTDWMNTFRHTGVARLDDRLMTRMRGLFDGIGISDDQTQATIRTVYEETGEVLDPHSAIAVQAAREVRGDPRLPMVSLACAHPAKFAAAVRGAIGIEAPLPPHLAHIMTAPERVTVLPNSANAVRELLAQRLGLQGFGGVA